MCPLRRRRGGALTRFRSSCGTRIAAPRQMPIENVTVVGAGVIGTGVAQSVAEAGITTTLIDVDEARLANAKNVIKDGIRLSAMMQKKKLSVDEVLGRIRFGVGPERAEGSDLVIENVTESWDIKRPLYMRLDEICPPSCIFAVNTSVISITRVGSVTRRPGQVLGAHFMNPVPLKPTVEVIRGFYTTDETLASLKTFLSSIGKKSVVVDDMPGFISNRVLMLTVNEAIRALEQGVAGAPEIDQIFRECFGHKMGPLETADLIGLDTILLSLEGLYAAYGERFQAATLLRKMVDAGRLGRKSGRGFHTYERYER